MLIYGEASAAKSYGLLLKVGGPSTQVCKSQGPHLIRHPGRVRHSCLFVCKVMANNAATPKSLIVLIALADQKSKEYGVRKT